MIVFSVKYGYRWKFNLKKKSHGHQYIYEFEPNIFTLDKEFISFCMF